MRPTTLFYLYRVRLRARFVQELLAVAGIAVGVALLFASQVANTSLTGSVTQLTNQVAGKARLQVVARDPHGFGEGVATTIRNLDGVKAAAPMLERTVNIVGPSGVETVELIAVNLRFLALESPLVAHINPEQVTQQQGLALPAPIARKIGAKAWQSVTVDVGARTVKTRVAVVLGANDVGGIGVASPIAVMPLVQAQSLIGMQGRVTRVLVAPQPSQDGRVQAELERIAGQTLNVRPADFEATVFHQAEGPEIDSTTLFSAISALVGFLFALNAMLLTVPQRRNLIADLRLDGYTPLEITEVLLFDVLALGVVGTLSGLLLGELLSQRLLSTQPGYLSLAFAVGAVHVVTWSSIVVATVGGMMAATLGVLAPLRREIFAGGAPEAAGTRSHMHVVMPLVGGAACVGVTSLLMLNGIEDVGEAILAFGSLTIALLLVLPAAFTLAVGLLDRIQSPTMGISSRIAIIELLSRTTRMRSLAIAATGAVAIFGSVAIEGAQSNLRAGMARAASDISRGTDLWVSPPGQARTLPTIPFEDRFRSALSRIPDVQSVTAYRGGFLDLGARRVLVLGPPRTDEQLPPENQVVEGDLASARLRLRGSGWLVMSQELAREQHLRIGQALTLASPHPTRFRVAALTTNFGWSPGSVVMNADDYAKAWNSSDVGAYQVALKPNAPIDRALADVRSAVGRHTALIVQTATRHEQNEIAGQKQGLARLTAISVLVLTAAALAMAAALAAMIWQRRPRFAGMKVDGFDEKDLWCALLWESALLLGIGCSLGAAFGLYGQVVLAHALGHVTGFPVVYSVGVPLAFVSVVVVIAISLAIVALPGYAAVRVRPALED